MSEKSDDAVFAALLERLEQGDPHARGMLSALHSRRFAEWQDLEDRAEASKIGTLVGDGPVVDVPLVHVHVEDDGTGTITGTSVPAGKCPRDSMEMTLRYVASERRVRGVCPLHPPDELDAS
jgi:hypothetical protein